MNRYELGPIGTNCYVVRADDRAHEAVVVDPGADAPRILEQLASLESTCAAILITHGHWDHLGGVAELAQATGAPVYMADDERLLLEDVNSFTPPGVELQPYSPDVALQGDEVLELGGMSFETSACSGSLAGASRLPHRGCGLFRRPSLCRLGRSHGPSRGRLGHARRVDPDACGPVPAGHDRLLGSRTGDDDWRRARPESVPRGAARVTRFEAPRGTHDILPSEQPLWEWVTGEMKEVASLYGYGRIDTPAFEDTDLIVRTSGGGSDVVQKETYTFTDRGGRSLTLRPEATAPICRAYVAARTATRGPTAEAVHDRADVAVRPAAARALPRALAALGRGDRHRRPCDRRRGDPALRRAPAPRRRHRLRARAQLDRRPELPSRLRRAAGGVARRA